ncbi:hypothetical protein EYR36_010583 [Pleurotus pulmonarius]|nr:hypothetical protein EYR36_010583 [Pleurotus pulmonarius]
MVHTSRGIHHIPGKHDTSTSAYDSTVITHPSSITSPRDVDFQFEPADGWIDNNRGRALDHVALIRVESS